MNPLMIMQLASTGLSLFGSVADAGRAKNQTKLNNLTAEVNAAKETTNTMRSYTSAMEEMTTRMKSQKAAFANARIDTASTLFSKGMTAHEKSFLEAKTGQSEALTDIQGGLKLTKAQNNYNLGATYKQLGLSAGLSVANAFMDYTHMKKMDEITSINKNKGIQSGGYGSMIGSLWGGK